MMMTINKSRLLKAFGLLLLVVLSNTLLISWRCLLRLIALVDGGYAFDDDNDLATGEVVHYNYRTGEIDAVKHLDGFYHK